MCDFDQGNHIHTVPALAAFSAVQGNYLLEFNNSETITAILTIEVNVSFSKTTELLFVAYSTSNSGHFLDKV